MKVTKKNFIQNLARIVILALIAYAGYLVSIKMMHKEALLELPISTWDFGSVKPGTRLEHSFVLRNTGTAPLIINKVSSSCGCLNTALSNDIVLPGKAVDLRVNLRTARYRRPINEIILLSTNDKSKPQVALKLTANVVTKLDVSPSAFNFGVLTKEDLPCSRSVRVSINEDTVDYKNCNDYKWDISCTDTPFLKSKIQFDPNNTGSVIIMATLSENIIPGPINGLVKITATRNSVEKMSREISCLGKILGPIAVLPDSIIWDWNRKTERESVTLKVIRGEKLPLQLEISPLLRKYVRATIAQHQICVNLLPEATIVNQQSTALKIVGTIWIVKKTTNKRILSIPTVILGK